LLLRAAAQETQSRAGTQTQEEIPMAAKRILMLVGDFGEDYEIMVPFQALLAGGTYADIAIDGAVTEGNLVSAPAWPTHPAWIAQFLQLLGTRITL